MKITVEGDVKEIKELLQAIASSEEQSKKIEDASISSAEITEVKGNNMPSLSEVYPTIFDKLT